MMGKSGQDFNNKVNMIKNMKENRETQVPSRKKITISPRNSQRKPQPVEIPCMRKQQKVSVLSATPPRPHPNLDQKLTQTAQLISQPWNAAEQNSHNQHNSHNSQESKKNEIGQQFDKLLEITSRCISYFNKFTEQKQVELETINEAFEELTKNTNKAFLEIMEEVSCKNKEICEYLTRKHQELLNIKEQQQLELKNTLESIKSIHLTNLLHDYQKDTQSLELETQLSRYAGTLNNFYALIERIEQNEFKDCVEESVSFINNLISEEIKTVLYEIIPRKMGQNASFSFNNEKMFVIESKYTDKEKDLFSSGVVALDHLESSLSEFRELQQRQKDRQKSITQYDKILNTN